MPPPPDVVRLRHMRDAVREALDFARGRDRSDLDTDRQLLLSIVKDLEILGEAASRVSEEMQAEHPHIPWRAITSMRNRLTHGYWDIDHDIVWKTVTDDLPPLLERLETALREVDRSDGI